MLLTMAACGSKNTDTDTDTKTGSEKKQLVVATSPDFPPFESLDGSDIVGIEPKLMQAIADKLGMELVWEQVDFDSIIPGIQAGRYDAGVAGISITADRLKTAISATLFPGQPGDRGESRQRHPEQGRPHR